MLLWLIIVLEPTELHAKVFTYERSKSESLSFQCPKTKVIKLELRP